MNRNYGKRPKLNFGLRFLTVVFCTALILGLFAGCATEKSPASTNALGKPSQSVRPTAAIEESPKESSPPEIANTGFSMTMLDVGQGLSLLIEADGHYMLYDGGGQARSSYVVSYLKQHGVTELYYMVASHYDEDHISGLVGVMNTTKVNTLLSPDYKRDTHIFESFCSTVRNKEIPAQHPVQGDRYPLGSAEIRVLGPLMYDPYGDNDNSIVLRISYGDFSCILSGDAEISEEYSILRNNEDISADLYVVGHHGSADSSNGEYVRAIGPKYAFLSVGKNNPYGHPNPVIMNTFMENNIQLFRTDQQGEITVTSDGHSISINKPPADILIGDSVASEKSIQTEVSSGERHRYVLNTNPSRKRIHNPDCRSVADIKPENFQYSDKTLEDLLEEGYTPCGNCHPN